MRRRFFVDQFESNSAVLRGDAAEHLGRVLRAEPGQLYELSDGERVWLARVERVEVSKREKGRIEFSLLEPIAAREPRSSLALLISLVKFDRFEWCLEKATELGAAEIVPLAAARSDKPLVAAAARRQERWERILLESAQQSRRLRPPRISPPMQPVQAMSQSAATSRILLSERRDAPSLRAVLQPGGLRGDSPAAGAPESVALAIGPEGGWTDGEIEAARFSGFSPASLGENVLRTETAVIAALAILQFTLES